MIHRQETMHMILTQSLFAQRVIELSYLQSRDDNGGKFLKSFCYVHNGQRVALLGKMHIDRPLVVRAVRGKKVKSWSRIKRTMSLRDRATCE